MNDNPINKDRQIPGMKNKRKILDISSAALLVVSVVLMILSLSTYRLSENDGRVARRISRNIEKKLSSLEGFMRQAVESDYTQWLQLDKFPEDMVVYRYCADTLQSWCNEFPIPNDNIRTRTYIPFLRDPRLMLESPLVNVGTEPSLMSLGMKQYVVESMVEGDCRIIGGVEISDFTIPANYTPGPISDYGGEVVSVRGIPLFRIMYEMRTTPALEDSSLMWAAIVLFLVAAYLFLLGKRSLSRLGISAGVTVAVMSALFFLGKRMSDQFTMFSPELYASSGMLYSLGAVVLVNFTIVAIALDLYLVRKQLCGLFTSRRRAVVGFAAVIIAVVLTGLYTFFIVKNIILNSGICLELYRIDEVSKFSVAVYISIMTMLLGIPLLLQTFRPLALRVTGFSYDALSMKSRVAGSLIVAIFLVLTTSVLGFRKEQDRLEMLANRLAFDRDIGLEVFIRRVEPQIAEDRVIAALSRFSNTEMVIQNRIIEGHFGNRLTNYSLSAYVFNRDNNTRASAARYNSLVRGGVSIADNSRFLYVKRDNGHSYYVGVFLYMSEDGDISRVVLRLEQRYLGSNRGYARIFGLTPPGRASIPQGYSYARYEGRDLKDYFGNYAYPTNMGRKEAEEVYSAESVQMVLNGYAHFVTRVGMNEVIVISRTRFTALTYAETAIVLALLFFLLNSLLLIGSEKQKVFDHSYFRKRITIVLLFSLISTLLIMATVSVLFVYSSYGKNMNMVMSDKISAITSMLEAGTSGVGSLSEVDRNALMRLLREVSDDTDSDITLYSPSGQFVMSSTPFVFERLMPEGRINGEAYGEIVYDYKRYSIFSDKMGGRRFYHLYAPIMGEHGKMIAIVASPYNEPEHDLMKDNASHLVSIVALFFVFMMVAVLSVSRVVDRMFAPLSEMSRNMGSSEGPDTLQYIEYDREDEISAIVQSYNRMVRELSESSKKLAQAERDKAWSEMARQVAHEIKNPLTPMKLQLQRVIYLKEKGDPTWREKFDNASRVILDHIDILADTANEFSTFAKLYTEQPVPVVLDKMIHEEISMFDNSGNIRFDFIALEGVTVLAPKPQLTRVIVNLLNNSIQAIGDKEGGRIIISLRHSVREGFYDIVCEDNGPGVAEENVEKLFTPNFTTKSAGSGLGLAISRSILEKCGATITYSRSFVLGGACFTICYPKPGPGEL